MDERGRGAQGTATGVAAGLELAALVAFAVTHPVLDRFGRAPDVFLFDGAGRWEVVAFGLAFSVVPLAALWAIEAAVGRAGARHRRALHLAFVGLAAWATVVNAVKATTSATGVAVAVAAAVATAVAVVAAARAGAFRLFLRYASGALPAFLALFLFASPVSGLVVPTGTPVGAVGDLERTPPVVVLVFDELPLASLVRPDGTIDAELFPGFARLAAATTWYRNATTVSGTTWYAVPAIIAGRSPDESSNYADPLLSDWPDNLFTIFGEGYRYDVQEAITGLCPTTRCDRGGEGSLAHLLGRGVDLYGDVVALDDPARDPQETFVEQDEPEIELDAFDRFQPDRFARFLDGLGATAAPTVHYLHLLLPHTPWRLLPSGRTYPYPERSPGQFAARWTDATDWPALFARQRQLQQVQYVDGLVGQFVDRLEETGLLDEAVIVVTSDHGIAFRPGQPIKGNREQDLSPAILPELAWVPLFVGVPGGERGVVDDRNALTTDVLPTIADVVGVELPDGPGEEGRSLLGPPRDTDAKPWYLTHDSEFFGVEVGGRTEIPGGRLPEVFALGAGGLAPDAPDDLRLHAVGPRADLVGRPVGDLDVDVGDGDVGAPGAVVDVAVGPRGLVDPAAGEVPALVTGTFAADPGPDAAVAIAYGGRIGAVSPVFDDGGPLVFAGMLPESFFDTAAAVGLELFLVSTTPGDLGARTVAVA